MVAWELIARVAVGKMDVGGLSGVSVGVMGVVVVECRWIVCVGCVVGVRVKVGVGEGVIGLAKSVGIRVAGKGSGTGS